jgi:hypothetical protein
MNGLILTIIMEDNLFLLEFFRCLRIGIAWQNNEAGKASSLILGLWKIETNITFAWRKKMDWHEIGEA